MKGLHKKIGVGVLVSGLLIGGVGLPGGSISYASSKNSEASGLVEIKDILEELKVPLPEELQIFLKDGFRGMLDDDYKKSELPSLVEKIRDKHKRELYKSVFGLGRRGNYAVIGFKLGGKEYCINSAYRKYWKESEIIRVGYNRFFSAARKRFEKEGVDMFEALKLKSGHIYRVLIEKKNEFLIVVFDKDGM